MLQIDPDVSLLLPCNVTIRALPDKDGQTLVTFQDPRAMVPGMEENQAAMDLVNDALARLQRAAKALEEGEHKL